MIVALILIGQNESQVQSDALETLAKTVLRGPFGGTLALVHPDQMENAREHLSGYAVQLVQVQEASSGPHAFIQEGLAAAAALRTRWEKAMAVAAERFGKDTRGKKTETPKDKISAQRTSNDVKLRGLARSFDRDGVMLFSDRHTALTLELQARAVEAFGHEGEKGASAKSFVQVIHGGKPGYPIIMSLDVTDEVAKLPLNADFEQWLQTQPGRILKITA